MHSCWKNATRPAQRSDSNDRDCPLGTVTDPPIWHASGTAARQADSLLLLPATAQLAERGAEGGKVAVECRVGTGLEGDVAFGCRRRVGPTSAMTVPPLGRNTRKTRPTSVSVPSTRSMKIWPRSIYRSVMPLADNVLSMLPWTWTRMGLPAALYRNWMVCTPLT
jgi:hypothetical protein